MLSFSWLLSNFHYTRVCCSSAIGNTIHRFSSLASLACVRDVGSGSHKWLPATLVGWRAQPLIHDLAYLLRSETPFPHTHHTTKVFWILQKACQISNFSINRENEECVYLVCWAQRGRWLITSKGGWLDGKSAYLSILFFLPISLSPFKMNSERLFTVESPLHALASCLKSASHILFANIQKTLV